MPSTLNSSHIGVNDEFINLIVFKTFHAFTKFLLCYLNRLSYYCYFARRTMCLVKVLYFIRNIKFVIFWVSDLCDRLLKPMQFGRYYFTIHFVIHLSLKTWRQRIIIILMGKSLSKVSLQLIVGECNILLVIQFANIAKKGQS